MSGAVVERMLIAVDDSIESLAAARTGAALAAGWNAAVRLITVVVDGPVGEALAQVAGPGTPARRSGAAQQLLEHVARDVRTSGVAAKRVDTVVREGEPFRRILEEARAWRADVIVMAVSHRSGLRSAYVGSETEHVLEFAECPVLVVPPPPRPH